MYKVQRGDTLSRIASKQKTSVKKIMAANPSIRNANRIRIGQQISLPGARDTFEPNAPAKGSASKGTQAGTKAAAEIAANEAGAGKAPVSGGAAEAAKGGAKGPSIGAFKRGSNQTISKAQVNSSIQEALGILRQHGVDTSKINPNDVAHLIQKESTNKPGVVNTWDSNARKGDPSVGLMQTTGQTFRAYHLPGYDQITRPVDNIMAAILYIQKGKHSSVSRVVGARRKGWYGY